VILELGEAHLRVLVTLGLLLIPPWFPLNSTLLKKLKFYEVFIVNIHIKKVQK
jgi:hypothetical protein